MTGFVIVDAAAKLATRVGGWMTWAEADFVRWRVAELEAEIQADAEFWGLPFRTIAQHRLEDLQESTGSPQTIEQIEHVVTPRGLRTTDRITADGEKLAPQ